MARLAVISDLHANLSALRAVSADIAGRGVDRVVVLGDVVGYLTRPNQVAAWVNRAGWQCIAGNYDLAVLTGGQPGIDQFLKPGIGPEPRAVFAWTEERVDDATRAFLSGLPHRLETELDGARLLAVHGSPEAVRQYVYPDHDTEELETWLRQGKSSVLCMGHTHVPFVRRLAHGLAVNPGSVGKSKDGDPRASYAVVDTSGGLSAEIVRVEWDIQAEAGLLGQAGLEQRIPALFEGV